MPSILDLNSIDKESTQFQTELLNKYIDIENWFRTKWLKHTPPFYGSVDIRNSIYKIAPIDMNLFPGGFNNLNQDTIPLAVIAAQNSITRKNIETKSVLIIPENHTRNTFYLENIYSLSQIIKKAGFNVRIGSINPEITEPITLLTALEHSVTLEPILRKENRLYLEKDNFSPPLILLNNDLSGGIADILKNLEQNLLPPLQASWKIRRKTHHFSQFDRVVSDFSSTFDIDPWSINPYFSQCTNLNFHERQGEYELAEATSQLLDKIQIKYNEKKISDQPFVIIKADAGTYGMGIMTVKSPEDVLALNRKNRNKMSTVKEGLSVTEVILQEGVYTYEKINNAVAEPVVYMMDQFVIGGFYRSHEGRGIDENLNASGMKFIPLSKEIPQSPEETVLEYQHLRHYSQWDCNALPNLEKSTSSQSNRFYLYNIIARLSLLAASYELSTPLEIN